MSWAVALTLGALTFPASAQDPEDPIVRRGTIRIDLAPELSTWHSRFGTREEGARTVEEVEPLGFDLTRDDVGVSMIPTLAPFQDAIARALAVPSFQLDLGSSQTEWTHSLTRIPIRLDVGITDWLTVSGMVPMVRSQPELDAPFRGDSLNANAGINPANDDPATVATFLSDLATDVAALELTTTSICEAQGPESPECMTAQGWLTEGMDLESSLGDLYGDPDGFVPLSGTDAGGTLEQRVDDFATGVGDLGQEPTVGAPPLSQQGLDGGGFSSLVTADAYGVGLAPLQPINGVWGMGDAEFSVAARLIDRRTGPENAERSFRYELGGEALVRLGTGTQPDPDILQDLGSGDGTTDIEVRAFGSMWLGRRWGLWGHARFGFQGGTEVERRVTAPDVPLSPATSKSILSWTPGNTVDIYIAPRYRFTESLSFFVPYQGYRKASDSFTLTTGGAGPPPDTPEGTPDVAILNEETSMTRHSLGVGLVYATLPAFRRGQSNFPMELRAMYQGAIGGSGGQTPKLGFFRMTFRLFLSFWGNGA